jgi:REP element-mobilizing transposase RayT
VSALCLQMKNFNSDPIHQKGTWITKTNTPIKIHLLASCKNIKVAIKQQFDETDEIYFITITCYNWLNLFQMADFYIPIYEWYTFMNNKNQQIVGYVIMPNHLHALIYIPPDSEPINKVIGEGKRFMAYKMIKLLNKLDFVDTIKYLQKSVLFDEWLRGKKHQVFNRKSDIKIYYNERIILQKLDYMHANPVSGKWHLVEDYTDYIHSSASFYELNKQGVYQVVHYKDVRG